MESFATPYPVVFHDGEQEHDKGVVGVHSVLSFKRFQALMSQKTEIPPTQLSAVFVCRRTLKDTDHKRQKLPINENTNFNIILNQHNPSREKDCHFLVSIKKSKKDRKGSTRKQRNADQVESYADEEDSNSSRGDLSPSDERHKPDTASSDIHEPIFSPDQAASPSSVILLRNPNNSPPTTPISLPNANHGLRFSNMSSPYGSKVAMTASEGIKVERTLLRREAMGQNGFASPRSTGWQNGRVELGFSVPSPGKGECPQNHGDNKPWMQLEHGRDSSARQSEKMISGQAGAVQQPHQRIFKQGQLVDLFLQDRFNDPMRPGSSGLARNSLPITSSVPMSRPANRANSSGAASNGNNFLPRVSMVTGTQSNSLMLQQAQVHLSHLQQQQQHQNQRHHHHHHQQISSMTSVEFSKLSGVLRGLVGRETSRSADTISTHKVNNCHRCQAPKNDLSEFHWCVNDTITMGFRGPSPAGPIGRPGKRHVEVAA